VPLVLAGGAPGKIAAIRQVVPDAIYTGWEGLRDALANAKPVMRLSRSISPSVPTRPSP